MMGRAYLNVRATGRSGYIPRPGKGEGVGEGLSPSLGKEGLGWL